MSNYVTEALGRALLDLMREKSIEKITADELTTRAKLAMGDCMLPNRRARSSFRLGIAATASRPAPST